MNLQKMMRQVQKMQAEMARVQDELATAEVEASAGGGAVRVKVSGRLELLSVEIEPEAVDPGDVEMLQDLVMAAVNEGLRKAQELATAKMEKVTGGLSLPGLGGLM